MFSTFDKRHKIINFQCLLKEFPKLCAEKKELFVLKCWCCIVPILGEVYFLSIYDVC